MGRIVVILPAGYVFSACGNDNENKPATDAGLDAATFDAGPTDAGLDAAADAGPDAAVDAGPDAATDAGSDAGPDAAVDAGSDAGSDAGAQDLTFTSSQVQSHTHDFTLSTADIDHPPGAGVDGDTTLSASHVHHVTLTQAQLTQIANGQTVMVQTSSTGGHTHSFAFHS
jgi:hypothetical protein